MFLELLISTVALVASEDSARQQVVCAETAFSQSAELRNQQSFLGFVDEEARFVSGEVLRGPAAVAAAWSVFFAPDGPSIRWRPAVVEVVANGTLAISRGPYRVVRNDDAGNPVESWGTFTSVWRLGGDGEWKVLFDAGGDAGKTPSEAERALLAEEPDCR